MPYVEGRIIHDADSHTMEPSAWLNGFATQEVLDYALEYFTAGEDEPVLAEIQNSVVLQADPDFRATAGEEIMLRKNFRAAGAWDGADRSVALDHLGFASQLVFPTRPNTLLEGMEHDAPAELTYATASAANRAQIAFCSGDPRLLPVAYVPLQDLRLAAVSAEEAIEAGAAAPHRMRRCGG